ncbi:TetR/AcrR family transcriptional regulator [Erwinia sp. V71]|uniref:TetR/AcrR family transcriptional regulator n=1 Tax=Erwinia sp. V71 TaxID=3369424 RepID=UPI003F639D23
MIVSYIHTMNRPLSPSRRSPGRPREFDLDAALDRAITLFSEQGYHGASISALSQAMAVTAGSLYKAFPDKHALFLAAFDRYLQVRGAHLAQRLTPLKGGREQIEGILRHYAEYSYGQAGQRGCLVVASASELASSHADIAARIAQLIAHYRQRFQQCIAQGQQEGTIAATVDAVAVAGMLVCITQGMRVLGKTGAGEDEINRLVATAMTLLG